MELNFRKQLIFYIVIALIPISMGLNNIFIGPAPENVPILNCEAQESLQDPRVVDFYSRLPEIEELAKLSDAIYASTPKNFAPDIRRFCDDKECEVRETKNGMRALIAIDEWQIDQPSITVVFRGTGDDTNNGIDKHDGNTNTSQYIGVLPPMYQDATELLRTLKNEYPEFSITTSGHSLGGALANVSSLKNDVNAVTFNPATLNTYNVVESIIDRQSNYTSSMVTVVNEKDRISGAKLASSPLKYQGALFVLPERWHCILKCNHNISEVRDRLDIISQSKGAAKKVCESYNGHSKIN